MSEIANGVPAHAHMNTPTASAPVTDSSGASRLRRAARSPSPRRRSSSPAEIAHTAISTSDCAVAAVAIPASTPASTQRRRCRARMHPAASGSAMPSAYTIENTTEPGNRQNSTAERRPADSPHQPLASSWTSTVQIRPPAIETITPASVIE